MTSCSTVAPLVANIYYRGPHLESALTPSLRRRLCETSASLLMPISACARMSNGLSPAASLFCGNFVVSDDQIHRLCFRHWSSPLCCPGWITVMLCWLAYRPICLIVSSLCSTLLLGRLLDCCCNASQSFVFRSYKVDRPITDGVTIHLQLDA